MQVLTMGSEMDVNRVLQESVLRPVIVFKHSSRCPRSARAYQEWQSFLRSPEAQRVTPAMVWVIEQRMASLAIARRLGVPHASPQVLLIRNGRAIWHASHEAITDAALRAVVRAAG